MRIITKTEEILQIPIRWKREYCRNGEWKEPKKELMHKEISDAIKNIHDIDKLEQTINDIIGNRSWTELPRCSECKSRTNKLIRFLTDRSQDHHFLCSVCMDEYAELLRDA